MWQTAELARFGKFYEKHRADPGSFLRHYYSTLFVFSQSEPK